MIDELRHIVRGEDFILKNGVRVHNPTLGEMSDYGEDKYAIDLSTLIIRPYDAMVMLDDVGVDYTTISDFDLFMMTARIMHPDKSLLLPDLSFGQMKTGHDPADGSPILYNGKIVFDKSCYEEMVGFLRAIHCIKASPEYKPGNKMMKKWLIDQERKKQKKNKGKEADHQYPAIISALVNNSNCKYNYETVWDLHISQFWDAFYRVNKIQSYQNTMLGVYTGNIDVKKLDKDVLAWFDKIDINAEAKIDESKIITPTS